MRHAFRRVRFLSQCAYLTRPDQHGTVVKVRLFISILRLRKMMFRLAKRRPHTVATIVTSIVLIGCPSFGPFTKHEMDETRPQVPATIVVGDPQVIARETLINDRLREVAHIDSLLRKSSGQQFGPDVFRDIALVQALTAQIGLGFDPAAGRAFARAEEIAELNAEIELIQLRQRLEQLKVSSSESNPNGNDENGDGENGTPDPNGDQDPSRNGTPVSFDDVLKGINKLEDSLNSYLTDEDTRRVESSPGDRFDDEHAYRARLRQRQTEAALDDVHDVNGNTLYRLQFTATVLPGKIKNKFGVLNFEILPPAVNPGDILRLYGDWLVALMLRGYENALIPTSVEWESTQSLLIQRGYVQIVDLPDVATRGLHQGNRTVSIPLFVDPRAKNILDGYFRAFQRLDPAEPLRLERIDCDNFVALDVSIRSINVFLSIGVDRSWIEREFFDKIQDDFLNLQLQIGRSLSATCPSGPDDVPEEFVNDISSGDRWRGDSYTYHVQPNQLVQRLSTVARAVNSVQAAVSLASALSSSGISSEAAFGTGRSAAGTAEAIERTPLVIGYTDRKDEQVNFGFVFGPKLIINATDSQFEYRQVAASYSVFADVSVPAWWSHMDLRIRSVWAANWHEGELVREQDPIREIEVRLRPQRFDADVLAEFLIGNIAGDRPVIESIYPQRVSACEGPVEFVIKGRSLWRGATAYLRGVRHESIAVLPDMRGVVVRFDVPRLPKHPEDEPDDRLLVWTTLGPAVSKIDGEDGIGVAILESSAGIPCNRRSFALVTDRSHIVGDKLQEIDIRFVGSFPEDKARSVRVIAQLRPEDHKRLEPVESDAAEWLPSRGYTASLMVSKPTGFSAEYLDGAPLHVGLRYRLGLGAEVREAFVNRPLVYYPTEKDSRIQVITAEVHNLPATVTLQTPANITEAFPGLTTDDYGFSVHVALDNGSKTNLPVATEWDLDNENISLHIGRGIQDLPRYDEFLRKWCAEDQKLSLSLVAGVGDVPQVDGEIILKKQTENCG